MAKLLKHLGIGVKKTPSGSSSSSTHRSAADYGSAPKSTSVQELQPKSPTRYRSSGSLTSSANHDFDTQSLKSFFDGQQRGVGAATQHGAGGARQGSLGGGKGGSEGHYPASGAVAYGTSVTSVAEEGEVFDSSPSGTATHCSGLLPGNTATPPRLLDEYCDPADLRSQLAESADLLGACIPTPPIDDDYSVPYEVKKIVRDVKLKDRPTLNGNAFLPDQGPSSASNTPTSTGGASTSFCEGAGGGGPTSDDSFDEPWEWTTKLNRLAQTSPLYTKHSNDTPLMTPKKQSSTSSENVENKGTPPAVKLSTECAEKQVKGVEGESSAGEGDSAAGTYAHTGGSAAGACVPSGGSASVICAPTGGTTSRSPATLPCVPEEKSDAQLDLLLKPKCPGFKQELTGSNYSVNVSESNAVSRGVTAPLLDRSHRLSSGGSLILSPALEEIESFESFLNSPGDVAAPVILPSSALASPSAESSGTAAESKKSPLSSPLSSVATGLKEAEAGRVVNAEEKDGEVRLAVESAASSVEESGTPRKSSHQGRQAGSRKKNGKREAASAGGSFVASAAATGGLKVNTDIAVEQQCWYRGAIGRTEAEDLLRAQREGSFLVRQSESNKLDYSLSLKSAQGFLHMKIVNLEGKFILGQFSQPFDSISLMIEFYCSSKLPIKGNEHICLVCPLSDSAAL